MSTLVSYTIAMGNTVEDLIDAVNLKITEGFSPNYAMGCQDAIYAADGSVTTPACFCQPMVKYSLD
jgi:hypothetical protein